MGTISIPKNYKSDLNLHDTQIAIKTVKDFFQTRLAQELNLARVSAPLFVDPASGLNDNLNGVERPVSFDIAEQNGRTGEVVHSLAKWKRYALNKYDFEVGSGLYTDMNAIRRDEITDKETQETSYIYYVDKNKFKEGDALVEPDSGEKFIIGDTEVLEGVFCVNQGYAVFRRIEILDENEEYAVVSKETYNGLVRYDRIVKNADKVSEQDILY